MPAQQKPAGKLNRTRKPPPEAKPKLEAGPPPETGCPTAVVGIGASAGGLEALRRFLGAMPSRTGAAVVVVVHLDPTHDSLMPELLAKSTVLHVEHARDGQSLEPDCVYVIPPNRTLTIERGAIRVAEASDRRDLRGVIPRYSAISPLRR